VELSGLETLLISDASKITEMEIHRAYEGPPSMGLPHVLRPLARRPTLTKLRLLHCSLGSDEVRLLLKVLRKAQSLQSLYLASNDLGSAGLAELAPALYRNTSIEVLDISLNYLNDMQSAEILRDILCRNKIIA
jgi:hypothetical protein